MSKEEKKDNWNIGILEYWNNEIEKYKKFLL